MPQKIGRQDACELADYKTRPQNEAPPVSTASTNVKNKTKFDSPSGQIERYPTRRRRGPTYGPGRKSALTTPEASVTAEPAPIKLVWPIRPGAPDGV